MTTGLVQDRNLEKQIEKQFGCMTGFLQIFDRHQLLNGKRIYSTKRLPPAMYSSPESEPASPSPGVSKELSKPQQNRSEASPGRSVKQSPTSEIRSPANNLTKSPLPLSVFEFKEGTRTSWKFSREAPRLSLDSRAVVDAKGSLRAREIRPSASFQSPNRAEKCEAGGGEEDDKQRRSTSVIARLMGLEPLAPPDPSPAKKSELRRSASESRVSIDLFPRFADGEHFRQNHECESRFATNISSSGRYEQVSCAKSVDPKECNVRIQRPEPAKSQNKSSGQRKSFFDSQDVFPEPKQRDSIYGEVEKRLRMRGIDEPTKDLETLKQILEALQLKGLLHSGKTPNQASNQRNYANDRRFSGGYDSPIVLMRPGKAPAPASPNHQSRFGIDSPSYSFRSRPGDRRNLNQATETASPRRNRNEIDRSPCSPTRNGTGVRNPIRRRPLTVENQRKMNDPAEQRRGSLSPVHPPKVNTRLTVSDQRSTNRSPKNRKPTAQIHREVFLPAEDEYYSVSESSVSTPSQTDTERSKDGRSLLERCDKLLLSIAEFTTTELQPSPVSVLDSSFYKETASSPSPTTKRSIDLKEQSIDFQDDEIWSPAISFHEDNSDSDFAYILEIFRALTYLPEDSDVFLVLEKRQCLNGNDTSKRSRIQRKLVFDTVGEIIDKQRLLPPWKAVSVENPASLGPTLQRTWSEFRRIRERDACEEDLFEVICGVLRKDLAGDGIAGWVEFPIEMSEAVLDIERLVFRDLIGETIRDLAGFAGNRNNVPAPRRKLVF